MNSDREQEDTLDSRNDDPASAAPTRVAPSDVETLEKELAALNDRYVRLAADFDNYRKRTLRDGEQTAASQKEAFIRELLPVVDNLERALSAHAASSALQLRRGIELTHHQMIALLARHGVEPDECLGQPFDPHRHEAVQTQYDPRQPDQVVLEVVQRGYRNAEGLLRPARVIVNDASLAESEEDAREGS